MVRTSDRWIQTWISLIHASTFLKDGLEAALQQHVGLRLAELDLLKQLAINPEGLLHGELAGLLFFSKAGMTKMLVRLEKAKLVERRRDPDDGRAQRFFASTKGLATWKASRKVLRDYLTENLKDKLPEDQLSSLGKILEQLLKAHGRWQGQIRHLQGGKNDAKH